jgi:hypothetical protein
MTASLSAEVAAALGAFVRDIDALDPEADRAGSVEIRVCDGGRPDGGEAPVTLREPVVRALVAALRAYHDPRDRGRCEHCGGRRLDDNFVCAGCGQPNGVFGQLLRERAARHGGPTDPGHRPQR